VPGHGNVLFTAYSGSDENASIDVLSLQTGQWKAVQRGGYFGRYLPGGYLVYINRDALFGALFDSAGLQLSGAPVPLLEDLASDPAYGSGRFAFSQNGTMVYSTGKAQQQTWTIAWLDSSGKMQPLVAPGAYYTPRLSPDGKRLAFAASGAAGEDIWVFDLQRENLFRLTSMSRSSGPIWTPDGKHIAFACHSASASAICWLRSDGAGETQRLIDGQFNMVPFSFSPDGRRLAFWARHPNAGADLLTMPLDISDPEHPKPGKAEQFLGEKFSYVHPAFSPDGRWLAYASNESGVAEIYVRPFPGPGGKWKISAGGGYVPMWSRGRKLFYETNDNRIMVVDYRAKGDSFEAGKPHLWSNIQVMGMGQMYNVDLAPDGQRLVVFPRPNAVEEQKGPVEVTFLLNFFDYVRQRVPAGK
jgi:serine/threonine-protein kinase